jgi:restriction system protein
MSLSDDPIASLVEHRRLLAADRVVGATIADVLHVTDRVDVQVIRPEGIPSGEAVGKPTLIQYPDVLLQATLVNLGGKTTEGQLVQGVSIAWFEIIRQLERDSEFLFRIDWRQIEELIAGAYERAGWREVILTPRSGDRGRDIVASKPGIGSIRIVDQVKAYHRGHRVTADEVRSVLGVLSAEPNVSKGVVTTTSEFAPGIFDDPGLRAFMPYRLELKDGSQLCEWLKSLSAKLG